MNRYHVRRRSAVNAACVALLMGGATAGWHAAAQTAEAPEPKRAELQTVVVTSQKRAELLKDVPQAVSAYGADDLKALGVTKATDLQQLSPSLNFTAGPDTRSEGFQMRGVGTSAFADTVEQSVGFMVDGVSLARSGQGSGGLIDVERVEVMRGPQGMLFGKNASAGLISVITKRPRFDQFSAEGTVSYSGAHNEVKTEVVANAGVSDSAAFRLAVATTRADGYVQNVYRNETLNDRDEKLVRAKALFQLGDNLDLYVIGDWGKSSALCCTWTARSAPPGTTFATLNAANGIVPGPRNDKIAANAPFYSDNENSGLSAELNYNLGWATLTSVTAARGWKTVNNNDPDILPINILDINLGASDLRQKSQELRLTSPDGGRVEWVGGVYWSEQTNDSMQEQTGNFGGLFTPFGVPAGANVGVIQDTTTRNRSAAAFGQAGVRVGASKFSAGLRYTDETVTLDYASRPSTTIPRPGYAYGKTRGETGANNLSWRLTAQHDLTRDDMAYVTAARGYKGPGLEFLDNGNGPVAVIKPEIPTTLEAGLRSLLFGGTTLFSAAVFKTRFEDFQAQVFDQTVTPARFRTTNAGRLDTQGVELEANSRITKQLTLSGAMAYIDAHYEDFQNIPCYAGQPVLPFGTPRTSPGQCIRTSPTGAAVTDGSGNRLVNSPRFTAFLMGRYDWVVGGYKAFAQADYAWRGDVTYSAAGDPSLVQGGYGLFGAAVGLGAPNGRWQVTLFGRNLGDKRYADRLMPQPTLGAPGVVSQFVGPNAYRTIGVTATVRFGT
ncbi:TonB-dependent receptor [Ramlibacter solisilvae]|uniref:TonB-dependent receptor n=1 Tax=Ramlibacter tataouinensis TaxID=94132 RepID=A0A127JVN5_9BURK|nr:TonB-dependent receptor [Ramlibacter tataouinensis]AMO24057.1 hypothetical protein UC35_15875 [Ramlibacter tataouinensis]